MASAALLDVYVEPTPPIQGWMTRDELQWLFALGRRSRRTIELGCWKGRSTHALLSAGNVVLAVDHFQGSASEREKTHAFASKGTLVELFMRNVGHFPNLIVLKVTSLDAAAQINEGWADAIFIDGEHTEEAVLADLHAWSRIVATGGILCGHDRDLAGVPAALFKFFGFLPMPSAGSIWACVKRPEGWAALEGEEEPCVAKRTTVLT